MPHHKNSPKKKHDELTKIGIYIYILMRAFYRVKRIREDIRIIKK